MADILQFPTLPKAPKPTKRFTAGILAESAMEVQVQASEVRAVLEDELRTAWERGLGGDRMRRLQRAWRGLLAIEQEGHRLAGWAEPEIGECADGSMEPGHGVVA